jgi:hypothetical protein
MTRSTTPSLQGSGSLADPLRLLVAGGRDYSHRAKLREALDYLQSKRAISLLIHGACHTPVNADKLAGEWAKDMGIPVLEFPVDHILDGPWPGAGPKRNIRMWLATKPNGVACFPGGSGTEGMAKITESHGVHVWWPYGKDGTSLNR